mmetsp:Transcript_7693/g.12572  ORF Transcript_7693/g.12572 Transcript_7693/m.12572 type:complete len:207 (-) Transcript_7693:201-821(-)
MARFYKPLYIIFFSIFLKGCPAIEDASDTEASISCNLTYYEHGWRTAYGLDLEQQTQLCREQMKYLKYHLAGRHGPIEPMYLHDIMCGTECLQADTLHRQAIEATQCSCLQLSTSNDSLYYSSDRHGDFCLENTGRMLCEELEVCEHWGCSLFDFMCPTYNYRKKIVKYQGGYVVGCDAGSLTSALSKSAIFLATAAFSYTTFWPW